MSIGKGIAIAACVGGIGYLAAIGSGAMWVLVWAAIYLVLD